MTEERALPTTHTPGPWRRGKLSDSIIADTEPEGEPHSPYDADCLEWYGGHLIAESVAACNVPLIAAAPDLFEAANNLLDEYSRLGRPALPASLARYLVRLWLAVEKAKPQLKALEAPKR